MFHFDENTWILWYVSLIIAMSKFMRTIAVTRRYKAKTVLKSIRVQSSILFVIFKSSGRVRPKSEKNNLSRAWITVGLATRVETSTIWFESKHWNGFVKLTCVGIFWWSNLKFWWWIISLVHSYDQHGKAKLKEHKNSQKFSCINDQTANDDGPRSEKIMKG